jgi:hypothetical protein
MVQFFLCFGKVLSTMCLLVPCLKILDVGRCGDDGRDEIQKKSVESGLDIMSRVESRAGFCVVHVDIVWRRFRRVRNKFVHHNRIRHGYPIGSGATELS